MALTEFERWEYALLIATETAYLGINNPLTIWPLRIIKCCGGCHGSGMGPGPHHRPPYARCEGCGGNGYPDGIRPPYLTSGHAPDIP